MDQPFGPVGLARLVLLKVGIRLAGRRSFCQAVGVEKFDQRRDIPEGNLASGIVTNRLNEPVDSTQGPTRQQLECGPPHPKEAISNGIKYRPGRGAVQIWRSFEELQVFP
ncbi:MAG: hypothetical protein ACREXS_11045 [Gammaproteobacteria bacterium]